MHIFILIRYSQRVQTCRKPWSPPWTVYVWNFQTFSWTMSESLSPVYAVFRLIIGMTVCRRLRVTEVCPCPSSRTCSYPYPCQSWFGKIVQEILLIVRQQFCRTLVSVSDVLKISYPSVNHGLKKIEFRNPKFRKFFEWISKFRTEYSDKLYSDIIFSEL